MIKNEDQQGQMPPQGKLVLPAYPDEEPYTVGTLSGAQGSAKPAQRSGASINPSFAPGQPQVRPEQLIQHKTMPAPKNPLAKIGYYWRKDPAYKVLMIAAVMVIAAGFIFVSFATAAFVRNPNLFGSTNTTPQNLIGSTPSGTVDLRPTFPPPGGGSGSNSSSQPPAQSTPILQVTATPGESITPTPQPSPTPGPGGGTLTVQITNIPGQVSNNSTVQVDVMTNEPGATVRLQVSYNAYPFYYQSGAQVTDGDGNARLYWNVQVSVTRVKHVVAKVMAVAIDANGQYTTSPTYYVQVTSGFGGAFVM